MTEVELKKQIDNAKGKRQLERNILEYCSEILNLLSKDQLAAKSNLDKILANVEMNEAEFMNALSGKTTQNIVFYDHTLKLVKEVTRDK